MVFCFKIFLFLMIEIILGVCDMINIFKVLVDCCINIFYIYFIKIFFYVFNIIGFVLVSS